MLASLEARIKEKPQLILCVLPERKNCDIYGKLDIFAWFFSQGHLYFTLLLSTLKVPGRRKISMILV